MAPGGAEPASAQGLRRGAHRLPARAGRGRGRVRRGRDPGRGASEVVGVAGVIDKDRCSARLASDIGADALVLLDRRAAGRARLRHPLGARAGAAHGLRRRARTGRGRLPGGKHGTEDRVGGAVRGGVGGARAGHVRRPPRRSRRRGRRHVDRADGEVAGAVRHELGRARDPRTLCRQRAADGGRAGAARRDGVARAEVAMGTPPTSRRCRPRRALRCRADGRRDRRRRAGDRGARRRRARAVAPAGRGRAPRRADPPRALGAAARMLARQRRAGLGPRRVRGAGGAPRAHRGAARLPLLRPRLVRATSSSSSAAAQSAGCS